MSALKSNPAEFFSANKDKLKDIEFNGQFAICLELEDELGKYLAIPATPGNKIFSQICGKLILGHLISRIDYDTYCGHVAVIKAYY